MGDVFAIARAIEPPDVRPYADLRRHRPLTGTAGLLLFLCMFMPALKGCGESTVVPLELPPFLPPYLYGLVFACAALARSQRGVMTSVVALRVVATLVTCAGFVVFLIAPAVGIVELFLGVVLIAAVGGRGYAEQRVALTSLIMGAVCTLWFAMWSLTEGALLGVHLSLLSSIGLLAGGAVWYVELWRRRASTVPVAIAVSSRNEGIGFDHRVHRDGSIHHGM
ncbi:hypothetical protein BH11MYX3_BH11MYX3_19690 [soil metagenome]